MKKIFKFNKIIACSLVVAIFLSSTGLETLAQSSQEVNTSTTENTNVDSKTESKSEKTQSTAGDNIVKELINERTENSSTYQLENGNKRLVQYLSDVRFTDENGELVDYDPTLKEIDNDTEVSKLGNDLSGYQYENKLGDMKNYLPTNLTEDTPILLENDNYGIGINPIISSNNSNENAFGEITDLGEGKGIEEKTENIYGDELNSITKSEYTSSDDEVSLEYISNNNGIKENIILNSMPESNIFEYEIHLQGTYPEINEGSNTIILLDKQTGDVVGNIYAPYMYDATEEAYNNNLKFEIEQNVGNEDSYLIKLIVDNTFLETAQYPVTIDPTITWTGNENTTDLQLSQYYKIYHPSFVWIGDYDDSRYYIKFNNLNTLLSEKYIKKANLSIVQPGGYGVFNIEAREITSNWSTSSITWSNQPTVSTVPLSTYTSKETETTLNMDLTNYVASLSKVGSNNFGVVLKSSKTISDSEFAYLLTFSDTSTKLIIEYYDPPTIPTNLSLTNSYLNTGNKAELSWSGITSQSLGSVQYKICKYNETTGEVGTVITDYSSSNCLGTTSEGTAQIPSNYYSSKGSYIIYVRGVDTQGHVGQEKSVILKVGSAVFDGSITLNGEYIEDSTNGNNITLSYDSKDTISSADIYASFDGKSFYKYGTFTNGKAIIDETLISNHGLFRIVATNSNGEEKLSNILAMSKSEYVEDLVSKVTYSADSVDTDEDGLEDGYEIWDFHTNVNISDTDGDGLSDGNEVTVLGTNPAIANTNSSTIDSDSDGLKDQAELNNKTNPYLVDSDFDGILDNVDTNPLKTDTNSNTQANLSVDVHQGVYDTVETESSNGITYTYLKNLYSGLTKKISTSAGNITKYYYDSNGNNTAVIQYAGGNYLLNTYTYDSDGNTTYLTYNGLPYSFSYDSENNLTGVSVGSQNLVTYDYTYKTEADENGGSNVTDSYQTSINFANGDKKESIYSDIQVTKTNDSGISTTTTEHLVTGVKLDGSNSLAFEYAYNSSGNISTLTDNVNGITYTYTYGTDGSLTGVTASNGFSLETTTQDLSNKDSGITKYTTNKTYNFSGVTQASTYNYESNTSTGITNSLTVFVSKGQISNITDENAKSNITSVINNSGVEILRREQNKVNDTNTIVSYKNGNQISYNYDSYGNIVSISQNGVEIASYVYDSLNQLIRENDLNSNKTILYTYDLNGNITASTEYSYTKGNVGTPIDTNNYVYDNSSWRDLLTSYNGIAITYDANGNPLNYRNGISFTWERGRSLATYSDDTYNISYKYNDSGIRTSKTVVNKTTGQSVTTNYTLDGNNIVKEENGTTTIYYMYSGDGQVTGFELNGVAYYYEKNIQGDIIEIYDSNGNEIVTYTYDAWGKITSQTDISGLNLANMNSFKYRGYYQDSETGFYYLQSRYYDMETKRFLNADEPSMLLLTGSIYQSNLFTYCSNNSVNLVDPTGCLTISISASWVAYIINVALAIIGLGGLIATNVFVYKLYKAGRVYLRENIKKALIRVSLASLVGVVNTVFVIIDRFTSFSSAGGIIANILDYLDGNYNGWIYYKF